MTGSTSSQPRGRGWPVRVAALALVLILGVGAIGRLAGVSPWIGGRATAATAATTPTSAAPATANGASLPDVIARVSPAVVTVTNLEQSDNAFGGALIPGLPQLIGSGSGFILDDQGHVVTNAHVVAGARELSVELSDGTTARATLVGSDPYQDVAVIQIDRTGSVTLPAIATLGDSSGLRVGDGVFAIGTALGEFRNTVTDGIVGGLGRSLETGAGYRLPNLIQHDAPISPGNSGGPLFELNGNVVGVNVARVDGVGFGGPSVDGIGFAIAINQVKAIADQLIANGEVSRPYLGIESGPSGFVVRVAGDGPAQAAGLQRGDVITAVNGQEIDAEHPLLNRLFDHKPGDTVKLTVDRGGAEQTLDVVLGTGPADAE